MKHLVQLFDKITGGSPTPLFKIKITDFGVYCESKESHSVYWYDNMGSVAKFLSLYGYNNADSKKIENSLNDKLLTVTRENVVDLKDDIIQLLQILPLDTYTCHFYESAVDDSEAAFHEYEIIFPLYDTAKATQEDLNNDFKAVLEESIKRVGHQYIPRSIDYAAVNFYDGRQPHLIATKHTDQLDTTRIDFYKKAILKGLRPPIIVCTGVDEDKRSSNPFILDGHHKAKAYIDLNINPAVIEIIGTSYEPKNIIDDLKQIKKALFKEQMIFLIRENYSFSNVMPQIADDAILSEFCLNGEIEEYYPNGNLRKKGSYTQSKRDGIFHWYFPDGTLKKREKYELGIRRCIYEEYFHNGTLFIKGDENGIIEQYNIHGERIK